MNASIPAIGAALLATACIALPPRTTPSPPPLEGARAAYIAAKNDPYLTKEARLELARAEKSLLAAEAAQKRGDNPALVERLADVARQRSLLAKQRADLMRAEHLAETTSAALAQQQAKAAREQQRAAAAEKLAERQAAERQAAERQAAAAAAAERRAPFAQQPAESVAEPPRTANQVPQRHELQLAVNSTPPRGTVLTLGDALFDVGKAFLKSGATRSIDPLAEFLRGNPERKVRIEGFTDSTGSLESNRQLSLDRANEVRNVLIRRGVPEERIETIGHGPSFPVASNATAAGRQQNRRIEIVVSDERGNLAGR